MLVIMKVKFVNQFIDGSEINMDKIYPRTVPDRDSKYMGQAWIQASFSKDPNTQVGAVIVTSDNIPLSSGYNGPPSAINDDSFSWCRVPEYEGGLTKYDLVRHAEINAMDYSNLSDLSNAVLYVTALPCPSCMLEIAKKRVSRVVYYDFQSTSNSSLQNSAWRNKSMEIAALGNVQVDLFEGNLSWLLDWTKKMQDLGIFK